MNATDSNPAPESDPGTRIEVSAGLIFRHGRLLITQRPAGSHLAGLWEFPGGKRHAGESFAECLRRELQEELGVTVEVGELIEALTHRYPEKTVHLQFYRCRLPAGEPLPLGCAALAWITPEELAGYRFPPADQRLLARLHEQPAWWRD